MTQRTALLLTISSGFLAVLLGAFGAHALKSIVSPAMIETWKTASFYHFIHTTVILIIVLKQPISFSKKHSYVVLGFLIGMLLFSGSLYIYVLSQIKLFALITPIGGLCLLLSWSYWFKVELSNNPSV